MLPKYIFGMNWNASCAPGLLTAMFQNLVETLSKFMCNIKGETNSVSIALVSEWVHMGVTVKGPQTFGDKEEAAGISVRLFRLGQIMNWSDIQ